jgi:hypothetical protein
MFGAAAGVAVGVDVQSGGKLWPYGPELDGPKTAKDVGTTDIEKPNVTD